MALRPILLSKKQSLDGSEISGEVKKIIAIKLMGLGTTTHLLHHLDSLKKSERKILFIGFQDTAELVKLANCANEVVVVRKSAKGLFFDLPKLFVKIRQFKPDLAIDFEPTSNLTALLVFMSGALYRLGFLTGKAERERVFTHLSAFMPHEYIGHLFSGLVSPLIRVTDNMQPFFSPLPRKPKTSGYKKILININASELSEQRLWTNERWSELINKFIQEFGSSTQFVFVGSKGEMRRVGDLIKYVLQHGDFNFIDLSGKTSIQDLLLEIRSSDLVVSVDSAIFHLSSHSGIPTIGLFGPENPFHVSKEWPNLRIVYLKLRCSPCLTLLNNKKSQCQNNQCMKLISPSAVVTLAKNLLPELRNVA